jgi:hypothetical protein
MIQTFHTKKQQCSWQLGLLYIVENLGMYKQENI